MGSYDLFDVIYTAWILGMKTEEIGDEKQGLALKLSAILHFTSKSKTVLYKSSQLVKMLLLVCLVLL